MRFVKITSIKPAGKHHVYDISMDDNEDPSFIADGFFVHNSYAAAESAYSTFLETISGYRNHLTHAVFYKKIFPLIAITNRMFKDESRSKDANRVVDFLFNAANRNNLKLPVLHWHKDLTAKAEDNTMDMLEKLSEKEVPIPLKMWLAAAGIDKTTLLRDAKEDAALRKELGKLKVETGGSSDEGFGTEASLTSVPLSSKAHRNRRSLLSRFGAGEMWAETKTGKRKYVHNPEAKKKDMNWKIAKIAAKAERDANYREELRKRNLDKMGSDTLN